MFNVCKSFVTILMIFLLIATSLSGYAYNVEFTEKIKETDIDIVLSSADIIIPDDFPSIQEGINHANLGETILVKPGIYKEHLVINTTGLTILGIDRYNTILEGSKTVGQGIVINAENVCIKNFTIQNFLNHKKEGYYSYDQAGIEIHKSNTTITDNRFIDNGVGIELYVEAYNTTITNNEMINDALFIGNYFHSFDFPNLTPQSFLHKINNNTVNGKPLYYFKNQEDFIVPTDAGQITMVNCRNFTIENTHMNNNDFSILLAFCHDSIIENNTITDTTGETLLFACENITIQNNIIVDTFKAICLEYKSKNNIVRYNDISKNYVGISLFNNASNNLIYKNKVYDNTGFMASGIEIVSYHGGTQLNNNISKNQIFNNLIGIRFRQNTKNTTVYQNNITENKIGIYLELSSDENKIIKNNFRKNLVPAIFIGCNKNTWENNYWNRMKFLPKTIFGLKDFGKIKIPSVNFDKKPAILPYEI